MSAVRELLDALNGLIAAADSVIDARTPDEEEEANAALYSAAREARRVREELG